MKALKKKLAIVGGGAHTIPTYRAFLKSLTRTYQIFLFSEFYIDPKEHVEEYVVISTRQIKHRRWRELNFGVLVLKECIKNKIDLIHSHSTYPSGLVSVITASMLRLPVLISLDAAEGSGIRDIGFGDLLHPKRKRVNQWVMNHASMLTALTDFQRKEVQSNLNIKKQIYVIPRGVETSHVDSTKRAPLKGRTIHFLNVAYIHPVKDHDTLLQAFKNISLKISATLTIVGKDYENGRLQQLAKTLGIEHLINFAGFIAHENIQRYFNDADILLHTSRYESQALVVVEAMTSGVLVCGTHVGLMADLADQCCITVPMQDDTSLVHEVINLIADAQKQERLRSAGLAWVQSHSLAWTTLQYYALYEKLLHNPYPGKNE